MRRCISLNPSQRPSFKEILNALSELSSGLQGATPTQAPATAAATPLNSRGSGTNGSRTTEAACGPAPVAALNTTSSPLASPPTSSMPSPFASGAAAESPTSVTPSPFAAAAGAAAAAAPTSAAVSPFAGGDAAAAPAAAAPLAPPPEQAALPVPPVPHAKPALAASSVAQQRVAQPLVSPFAHAQ